jgi:mercuric ion transport protein
MAWLDSVLNYSVKFAPATEIHQSKTGETIAMTVKKLKSWPLIGGVVAAIGASLCCIGPLVLVLLGVGGAWAGSLGALEPVRPYFLAAAVVALFFAWRQLYDAPTAPVAECTPGSLCALPQTHRVYKILFWLVAVLIVLAIIFPYLAPLFY